MDKIIHLPIDEKIIIIRVIDKNNDEFFIPQEIEDRIIKQICIRTSPEIEMLIILNEGLFDSYNKNKHEKPSVFIKNHLKSFRKGYDYFYHYFSNLKNDELVALLKEYDKKRRKANNKNEESFSFLIKD